MTTAKTSPATGRARKQQGGIPVPVIEKLREAYGDFGGIEPSDSLDYLMFSHLLAIQPLADAIRCYHGFHSEFVDWNEVRISDPEEIARLLAAAKSPLEQATFIKRFLHRLFIEKHHLSVEFLRNLNLADARAYLKKAGGFQESTLQLLLTLLKDHHVFPTDGWMMPCAERLGLLKEKGHGTASARELFEKLGGEKVLLSYALLAEHARRSCPAQEEALACPTCAIKKSCPYPKKVHKTKKS